MNRRPLIACATAALGLSLVLVPVAAQAAPATTAAASSSSAVTTPPSPVVSTTQSDSGDWQIVTVNLSTSAYVELRDDHDQLLDSRWGDANNSIRFIADPNGADVRAYTLVSTVDGRKAENKTVLVDFSNAAISRPVDQTSYPEQTELRTAIQLGEFGQTLHYKALPFADVTVTANGQTHTVEADAQGDAFVPVLFQAGSNRLAVSQQLGAKKSAVYSYGYLF
ncbi:hypothetical protein [Curtobacterium sp. Leaf261]|uniref:hypothetical protein n=1 Tax=Curtobacterium sp. Leaf261 TaxID=1736311 RepID=UPI0006F9215E|nr:hypothetical protein [Curtobacterium sp. Leaf261]KQO62886.1 hypothetical protein ASF23_08160 [Curtobacterium sp. Leaf261]